MLQKISVYDPIKLINIEAYTDGYSHDEHGNIFLMSIIGHDSAAKGISSAIVSIKEINIEGHGTWESLGAMRGERYRIMSARLESGLLHQIVSMDALFKKATANKKLIFIGQKENANTRDMIFDEIRTNFGTPMLGNWRDWILHRIYDDKLLEILEGNIQIARLDLNEKHLDSIISNGVTQKSIGF